MSARAIFIAGPTASGKSGAALAISEIAEVEIINADAIQVYRDLEILSARPDPDEIARVPHHLYGEIDGSQRYSAGLWAKDAAGRIEAVAARGRAPLIVGGTGLYFKALAEGLSPMPSIADDVRILARTRLDAIGLASFRQEVIALDPPMAALKASDTQRLMRAWEVAQGTGIPLSRWQAEPRAPLATPAFSIVIEPQRAALYEACDARFDQMLAEGAVAEVERLIARNLAADLPVMNAVGVVELSAYLTGRMRLDEAAARAKLNTRRLAKRQTTWFRGQAADWPRAPDVGTAIGRLKEAVALIQAEGRI